MATAKKKSTAKKKPANKKKKVGSTNPTVIAGTKKKKPRKKKMGSMTGSPLLDGAIGYAVGAGGSVLLNKFVPIPTKAKIGIEIVGGIVTAVVGVKKKNAMAIGVGAGMGSVGLMGGLKEAGVITGMEEIMSGIGFSDTIGEDTMLIEMNGTNLDESLNGANPTVISGPNDPDISSDRQPNVIMG